MFSNLLPVSSVLFNVTYREYAKSHFLKEFEKKYKGKQWEKTELSIFEDLKRLRVENNTTQQSSHAVPANQEMATKAACAYEVGAGMAAHAIA